MDSPLIQRIVEAAILASSQPVTLAQLRDLFPVDQSLENGAIENALDALQKACEGRGVELVEVASGFRYQVRTEVHPWVARLWAERPQRYTRATLETLALIAYRQPITRGEIEQIRGVAVSSNIVRMLEEREWIRVIGHRDVPGKPALFGTTRQFLDYFNLKSLDELPPLSELRDLTELEPQLPLDGEVPSSASLPLDPDPELPEPSIEDATDVVIAPDIPATAAIDLPPEHFDPVDSHPLDADDDTDTAPEHTA
ncbi:SMC-Scp complex subunit ScpB [Xanthomonadaceae bacterium JHOS43]|nr:SMC-Scp complex subunit ScpB [Xanthomonadaceae bacterium JHOS43]MCX7563719.1 SMC-Scp complex subunit ScpB [Xanthomonadaceae bacterium XH05]